MILITICQFFIFFTNNFPAEIYINQQMTYEFYNEEYENVAVLFATITNFDVTADVQNEKGILNVLNEIICDFDEILLSFRGPQKIEKIKVAGWTYVVTKMFLKLIFSNFLNNLDIWQLVGWTREGVTRRSHIPIIYVYLR